MVNAGWHGVMVGRARLFGGRVAVTGNASRHYGMKTRGIHAIAPGSECQFLFAGGNVNVPLLFWPDTVGNGGCLHVMEVGAWR